MKKSKGIGDYLKSVQKAVEKGPTPRTMWMNKGYLRRICEGRDDIRPDILKVLNDNSIPDLTALEVHEDEI